jgi:hypothetical protein
MKSIPTFLIAAMVAASTLSSASRAWALGPVDVEVAAKAGLGSQPLSGSGPNPLGFGIGGRAGVTLFSAYYAGVAGMYYLGSSQGFLGGKISDHAVQYGVEAGYNIYLLKLVGLTPDLIGKLLTLRPQVGVGNLTLTVEEKNVPGAPDTSADQSNLYIEPGLTALVTVGPLLAGLDVNALWVPNLSDSNVAVTAHAQLGLKF